MISNPELMTMIGHAGLILFAGWTVSFIVESLAYSLDAFLKEFD